MEEMRYAIAALAHIPVRKTVADTAEMVTELLFGDLVRSLDSYRQWVKVENISDGYEGWVDGKQLMRLGQDEFEAHSADRSLFFTSGFLSEVERLSDHAVFHLGMGCRLPFYDPVSCMFRMGEQLFLSRAEVRQVSGMGDSGIPDLLGRASSLVNTPYLWGGKSSFALDCSGFVQLLFRMYGCDMPRDASRQALVGETVPLLDEARAGDLLFFDNQDGQIIHVGIYAGNGRVFHCSGSVRADPVDHEGIFRHESGCYSHHLRLIKRIFR